MRKIHKVTKTETVELSVNVRMDHSTETAVIFIYKENECGKKLDANITVGLMLLEPEHAQK